MVSDLIIRPDTLSPLCMIGVLVYDDLVVGLHGDGAYKYICAFHTISGFDFVMCCFPNNGNIDLDDYKPGM